MTDIKVKSNADCISGILRPTNIDSQPVRHSWASEFQLDHVRPLIICRGPIRQEAIIEFTRVGITHFGILLSEKDAIIEPQGLSPELRGLPYDRIHRITDYSGVNRAAQQTRIVEIISIAKQHNYNAIFAGYGFMSEVKELVVAIENAGLIWIGPCSKVVDQAGCKDQAKAIAANHGVSVVPGVDDLTRKTVLSKYPTIQALQGCAKENGLSLLTIKTIAKQQQTDSLHHAVDHLLFQALEKGIDLFTVEELCDIAVQQVKLLLVNHPGVKLRFKAVNGGGGKGQRLLPACNAYQGTSDEQLQQATQPVPELIKEVLQEVQAIGPGANKNILIELNLESTRHQEVQLIGNGDWCLALGARDCSCQMHAQKLLELSLTQEELSDAIVAAKADKKIAKAKALQADLDTLKKMEQQAVTFGQAVGLDSVSTFECIVAQDQHYFMEMNTRIQVEHRVTELCYLLRFNNPKHPSEYFEVKSLVELMLLLALHGDRLPLPKRMIRNSAAVEVRLNATNDALYPHAGGKINHWSAPLPFEVRDDQGICVVNPDTGAFIPYTLVGAYDSNIALLLTYGDGRQQTMDRMIDVLRCTLITGEQLKTNLSFLFGLTHWIKSEDVWAKLTTHFIECYLIGVGRLKEQINQLDLNYAYSKIKKKYVELYRGAALEKDLEKSLIESVNSVFEQKQNLLLRPLLKLISDPHLLMGWLSLSKSWLQWHQEQCIWTLNPIVVLSNTYEFLSHAQKITDIEPNNIWPEDFKLLADTIDCYRTLEHKLNISEFPQLDVLLKQPKAPLEELNAQWSKLQSAHLGYQMGLELLSLFHYVARKIGFYQCRVNPDLNLSLPPSWVDNSQLKTIKSILAPPPVAKADEILAESGGMFYAKPGPSHPPFVQVGDHFEVGDPLYVLEVMKMFNTVRAQFSGTVKEILLDNLDGAIIKQGQPIMKVIPDEAISQQDPNQLSQSKQAYTDTFLSYLL